MEFGKSFLLSLIVEKILALGVNVAREALDSNQEKIDAFIRNIIPGEWLDNAAIEFVHANLPLILNTISKAHSEGRASSVSSTLKAIEPGVELQQTVDKILSQEDNATVGL